MGPETATPSPSPTKSSASPARNTITTQLQVFVHRDYLMKGVGSCLMDKMLALLDPTHVGRGRYEVVGAAMDGMGAKRRVRNLILDFPFDRPQTLEWFGRWMRGMGFVQAGAWWISG